MKHTVLALTLSFPLAVPASLLAEEHNVAVEPMETTTEVTAEQSTVNTGMQRPMHGKSMMNDGKEHHGKCMLHRGKGQHGRGHGDMKHEA